MFVNVDFKLNKYSKRNKKINLTIDILKDILLK